MSPRPPFGQTREKVYRFVRDRIESGLPPTVRDVQAAMGFRAVQSAREHLERLVSEGRLLKQAGTARGYRLPQSSGPLPRQIPILGRVQAGALTAAIEDLDDTIPIDASIPGELFALRVRGFSMKDLGILPNDIVIVRSQPTANSGEIVVALVDDEATVKTLKIKQQRIELHPANDDFEPIIPPPDQCTILGKVIEVRRSFEATRR